MKNVQTIYLSSSERPMMAAGFSTFIKEMLLTEGYNQVIFMKKIIKSVAGILILLSNILLLPAQEIIEPVIKGITDKSPLSYNIGEEMVFSFKLEAEYSRKKNTYLKYFRRGDDGNIFSGTVPADRDLVLKTSLDRAGFVGIDVFWVDNNGKNILNNGKKVAFYAGAGVQPETLQDCGEPSDFDDFWAKQRAKLDGVPFKDNIEKILLFTKGNMSYYKVKVPCYGPRPLTAYLCMPTKSEPHSLKAEVHFMGYGAYKVTCPTIWPKKDRITLVVNAHGMELQQSDEYYKEFFASIRTEKYGYGFNPEENKNAETAYFHGMTMRALRALDYVKTLPEWDQKNLIAVGGSQAGLQTMWVTALDKDVTEAYPSIIWCCDMAGTEKKSRCHGGWRLKYFPALDYYDPVFMAKRIKNAKVVITRAGLGDYICPPSGLAVCYNNLATPDKEIVWVQGSNHDFTPKNPQKVTWSTK